MHIAVIGAGNIGSTLGRKWIQSGHLVRFGVRSPADPRYADLKALGAVVPAGEALTGADVVVLAQPGAAVAEFATQFGADLTGKVVIDTTNNPRSPVMNNLDLLRSAAPGAHLIRAFSTLGWENFAHPQLDGQPIDLFFAGSPAARSVAEQLIGAIGLRPIYLGDLEAAPALDGLTRAWFALVFGQGRSRRLAFKLVEEPVAK